MGNEDENGKIKFVVKKEWISENTGKNYTLWQSYMSPPSPHRSHDVHREVYVKTQKD